MAERSCPDATILEKFSVGALSPGEADALSDHVENCEHCIGTLHGLKVTDTLLDAMRRPAETVDEPDVKLVEQLANKVSALSAAASRSSAQTIAPAPDSSPSATVNLDEDARRRFEAAWLADKPEPIEAILSADNVPHYLATLEELVQIEMEFRWRLWAEKDGEIERPSDIENYLGRFPRLNRPDIVERLVEQEFRVRSRHGDNPKREEYQARFPNVSLSGLDDGKDVQSFLAPPEAPDELGRLGSYRVLKVLGSGGMGVVYMAEDPQLKRLVALKVMKPDIASRPEARIRFLREARAVAAFNHDHILSIFQVGEDRGVPFLAMPLLEGETLDDRLKREGRLPIEQVLRIGREIADGLAAAHDRGLIHRDIKPANVWLETRYEPRPSGSGLPAKSLPHGRGSSYRVKIMDFGLARPVESDARLTQSGVIVGSPAYMAPEQARGERVDSAADLFSLGCVLYRASTGQLPFKAKDAMSTLMAVIMDTPAPPREVQPDVPAELSDFILKLLAKKPDDRPASAQEVVQALQDIEENVGQAFLPAEPVRQTKMSAPRRRRHKLAFFAGIAALAACIVAGIVLYWPTRYGTVRIEINDPNIQVLFDKDGALIRGLEKQDIPIRAGEHFLTVTHDKLTFDTKLFSVRKGETVAIKIEMLDGKLQVTHAGKVIGEAVPPVTTTRWALEFDGASSYIELPPFPFDGKKGLTFEAHVEVADPGRYQLMLKAIDAKGGFGWGVRNGGFNLNLRSNVKGPISQWHGIQSNAKIAAGVQMHLAAVFDGKSIRIFQDGQEVATHGVSGEPTPFAWEVFPGIAQPSSGPTYLGCWFESGAGLKKASFFKGRIHEIRVSNIPRYAKAFVPAARMRPDPATIALYHCKEGQGDKLIDTSGNNRHGKIVGANWVQITPEAVRGTEDVVSPHRPVAEWVLQQGRASLVKLDDGTEITAGAPLPDRPFKIAEIHFFADGKPVTDEVWLDKLSELPDSLSGLWFFGYVISDETLSRLTSLPATRKLQQFHMNFEVTVSDAGLKFLLSLPSLKHLSLVDTNVTNEGLKFIRDNLVLDGLGLGGYERLKITQEGLAFLDPRLKGIGLAGLWATDSALEYVLKLNDLRSVSLSGVNTTDEGTRKLLQRFPKMTLLRLEGNAKVTAKILPALASLQSLSYLDLNRFAVTDDGLKHLYGLKNLRLLLLTGTQVTPDGVRALQKALPACKIRADFDVSSIDGDRRLAEWILRQSKKNRVTFDGIPEPISSVDQLPTGAAKLREIQLGEEGGPPIDLEAFLVKLQGAPVSLAKLMFWNQHLDDATLKKLAGLPQVRNLQELWLRHVPVTDDGLAHLRQLGKLRTLELNYTAVTGKGLKFIGEQLPLQNLRLSSPERGFTEEGLANLSQHLEVIIIDGPWFGDSAVDHLLKLPKLNDVGFGHSPRFTNAGVEKLLKGKPNLRVLHLSHCTIDDKVLPAIAAIPSIRHMTLKGLPITDKGLRALHSMKNLRYVDLHESQVTAAGVQALQTALPKCKVESDFTKP